MDRDLGIRAQLCLPSYAARSALSSAGDDGSPNRVADFVRWHLLGVVSLRGWAAATHFPVGSEPDLIGFSIWLIFLSLAFFTCGRWRVDRFGCARADAAGSRSAVSALGMTTRLGKPFTSELFEIGMVMGIVNLALIVVAMVLSAAPLPFSDQLGGDALHVVWAGATVFYLSRTTTSSLYG